MTRKLTKETIRERVNRALRRTDDGSKGWWDEKPYLEKLADWVEVTQEPFYSWLMRKCEYLIRTNYRGLAAEYDLLMKAMSNFEVFHNGSNTVWMLRLSEIVDGFYHEELIEDDHATAST